VAGLSAAPTEVGVVVEQHGEASSAEWDSNSTLTNIYSLSSLQGTPASRCSTGLAASGRGQARGRPREAAKHGVPAGSTGQRRPCSEALLVTCGSSSGVLIRMRSLVRFQLAPPLVDLAVEALQAGFLHRRRRP
jgi:hypothetical protein